jgi:hypothetical protein
MTEDEAKVKRCCGPPAAAHAVFYRSAGTSMGATPMFCIGSSCMAWRVTGSKFKDACTGQLSGRDLTGNGQWIETGFCGLAGTPS